MADARTLVVTAERGLTRQTKRHSVIVSTLGVRHLVVAVNKMDLVGWSKAAFDKIESEFWAFAKDLDIEIKAVVNPDGTVRQATIINTGRYAADAFFRAAADSAKRAVLNPQCSPLHVPPDKYEAWHNLDLFFNPKDLL